MEENYQQQMRKGMLVLAILSLTDSEDVYVADMIRKLGDTQFATQEGTLYPLLSKLKREGLLNHTWIESPSGPPRKYYSLTAAGKEMQAKLRAYLGDLERDINTLGDETV